MNEKLKSQQCFVLRTKSSVYAMLNKCTFFVVQHACDVGSIHSKPYTKGTHIFICVFFVLPNIEREFKIKYLFYLKFMKWHIVYIVARGIVMPKSYSDIVKELWKW